MKQDTTEIYDPFLALIADHLTAPTRAERKVLLTVAAASVFVFFSGAMPESIPSLGIGVVQSLSRRVILGTLIGTNFYFLIMFYVYWLADYWTWERNLRRAVEALQKTPAGQVTLEEAIRMAIKQTEFGLHGPQWLRPLMLRLSPLVKYFKLRGSAAELKQKFADFAEGKVKVWRLCGTAAPSSLLRLLFDGPGPMLFAILAIALLVYRYHGTPPSHP